MANILLMGADLRHGNLLLRGWHMSDVSFYPTELVQYALLESVLGLRMMTAHVAAAMTYTLVVLLAVLLARGGTSGRAALVRTLIVGGIMVAPQLSVGVYAVDLAVGHIGTSVPLLLAWLLLDRAGPEALGGAGWLRWRVPVLLTVILAWVLIADPIVLITGIGPLALVAGARFGWPLIRGRRGDRRDAVLAGAAVTAFGLAWVVQATLRARGGYVLSPLPVHFRSVAELSTAVPALWKILDLFGADFRGMHPGVPLALALAHLASVLLAAIALIRAVRPGVTLVDQVLATGIILNLSLYLGTLASTQGAHEIAIVLPYAAALVGRLLTSPQVSRTQVSPLTGTEGADRGQAGQAARAFHSRTRATAGALLLLGYLAGFGYELTAPSSPPANSALAAWLLAHGFRSGLGGYWQASSITVETAGRVKVRAVTGSLSPYLWMTNTTWYDPTRNTANFLILQKPAAPELKMLTSRFGPPAHEYKVDGYTVLTWPRNLLRN